MQITLAKGTYTSSYTINELNSIYKNDDTEYIFRFINLPFDLKAAGIDDSNYTYDSDNKELMHEITDWCNQEGFEIAKTEYLYYFLDTIHVCFTSKLMTFRTMTDSFRKVYGDVNDYIYNLPSIEVVV